MQKGTDIDGAVEPDSVRGDHEKDAENPREEGRMKVSFEKPPVWDEAGKVFPLDGRYGVVFTYGDTLYNPWKVQIPTDLRVHEEEHMRQQGGTDEGAKAWWDRYLSDKAFMVEQEAEAYAAQYAFVCGVVKDRNKRVREMRQLAQMLSGELYGNAVSLAEAERAIRANLV